MTAQPPLEPAPNEPAWSLTQRISFRFVFCYVVLFFFPLPSGLADPDFLSGLFDPLWHRVVPWVARHTAHVEITAFSGGSGDTTYDYVRLLCFLVLSAVATLVWSILDRRRTDYRALHAWARIWLRYAVAASMFTYGIAKLFKHQFYDPSYNVLTTPVGELSPQRMLWTFIGVSKGYTFFAGAGEFVGGVLLLFRRTTLLGALLLIAVLSNVVALNVCYDVCVKVGSMHLLAAAILLAAPDAKRLAQMFVLDRPVGPGETGIRFTRPWMRRTALGVQTVVIGAFLVSDFWPYLARHEVKVPSYMVSSFLQDGEELAAADGHRLRAFQLSAKEAKLQWGSSTEYCVVRGDPKSGPVTLLEEGDDGEAKAGAPPVGELRLGQESSDRVTLEGTFKGHPVHVSGYVPDPSKLRLLRTGFHWMHEAPDSEPR